jgi:hypothetical protein
MKSDLHKLTKLTHYPAAGLLIGQNVMAAATPGAPRTADGPAVRPYHAIV